MAKRTLFLIIIFGLFFAFVALIGYQTYIIPQVLQSADNQQDIVTAVLSKTVLAAGFIWILFSFIQWFLIVFHIKKLTKVFFQDDINIKIENEQKAYNDILQLYRMATTDKNTGVMLFKPFMALVEKEMIRGRRYNTPFTLGKIVLNHQKDFDSFLHKVTLNLKTTLREIDSISINEKKEIYILLPNIKKHSGFLAMKRVDKRMRHIEETNNIQFQLSVAIASFPDDGREIQPILKMLDQRIEKSKLLGNNTIIY